MKHLNPIVDIGQQLNSVQGPARYLGGETGICIKADDDVDLTFAIAFPDVYEIAMANQAIKIIYNGLNKLSNVRCERVFAPEHDFELLLEKLSYPLYTLESYIPLCNTDVIGFSIGYELGMTGVLSILATGKVSILKKDRKENEPILIAGGVGATNPAPFADFFDAVFIGEAENELFELVENLATAKKNGASRSDLLEIISSHPAVWIPGKRARRAVFADFGKVPSVPAYFPLPTVKPVQDHGVVEIMRGCPNGCRFCHAGIYYRPQRVKSIQLIIDEVDKLVFEAGYREISLTSLSSADYPDIDKLLEILNKRYAPYKVSFQLPSLKVNSFTLPLLEQLSEIRKSGLTFAVETPDEFWQLCLNKEVYFDKLTDIILEAKKRGWNKAKFYFMIGLPLPPIEDKTEAQVIVDFLLKIQAKTGIQCNVNVGTFIPKPHTAFERVKQLSPEEFAASMAYIKDHLPRGKFHVGINNEFVSLIEGLISRGGIESGRILYNAWKKGCRLDAWEDHLREDKQLWIDAMNEYETENNVSVRDMILRERNLDEKLPWDEVSLGPTDSFYKQEFDKSQKGILTQKCSENCDDKCGVCNKKYSVNVQNSIQSFNTDVYNSIQCVNSYEEIESNIPVLWRVVFMFQKQDVATYLSHLAMQEIFRKVFSRSKLPVMFTNGFNPLPRMEFASSLSLGIESECEIGSCVLRSPVSEQVFADTMNEKLTSGITVTKCYIFPVTNLKKRESLASLLWGASYEYVFNGIKRQEIENFFQQYCDSSKELFAVPVSNNIELGDSGNESNSSECISYKILVSFTGDRKLRDALAEYFKKPIYEFCRIIKKETLAIPDKANKDCVSPCSDDRGKLFPISYFELYKDIAEQNAKLIEARESSK